MDSLRTDNSSVSPETLTGVSESPVGSTPPEQGHSGEFDSVKISLETASQGFSSLAASLSVDSELSRAQSEPSLSDSPHSIDVISSKATTPDRVPSEISDEGRAREEQTIKEQQKLAQNSLKNISQKYSTKQTRERERLLKQAVADCDQALTELRNGNPAIARFYKDAGVFSFEQANEKIPVIALQYSQIREACLGMIEEEKNQGETKDQVIQMFQSAIKYSKIAAREIKGDQSKKDFNMSLEGASSNFLKAAQSLQQQDRELSDAYFYCAVSHCYLLIAREPRFIKNLSSQEQALFKKESQPNLSLIDYWENAVVDHGEKIEELLATRYNE